MKGSNDCFWLDDELAVRYLQNKLSEKENIEIEEHLIECAPCAENLRITQCFSMDLRFVMFNDPFRFNELSPTVSTQYFPKMLRVKLLAVAATVLLMVSTVSLMQIIRRLRLETMQAKTVSRQLESRYEQESQIASESDRKHQETEQQLIDRLSELEAKLHGGRNLEAKSDNLTNPEILSIFSLSSSRGSSGNDFTLSKSAKSFIVLMSLFGEKYKEYSVTILDSKRQIVWKRDGVKPDSMNLLCVNFDANFLRSEEYLVNVEARNKEKNILIESYAMRIHKNRR